MPTRNLAIEYLDSTTVERGGTLTNSSRQINSAWDKIDAAIGSSPVWLQLACSDLATALAIAANVASVRAPHAFTVIAVRASLQTGSSAGPVVIDIKKNGGSILSTALSIDATQTTSTTAASPPVISIPAIADDDAITIDITGAGTGAKGLVVLLIGHT